MRPAKVCVRCRRPRCRLTRTGVGERSPPLQRTNWYSIAPFARFDHTLSSVVESLNALLKGAKQRSAILLLLLLRHTALACVDRLAGSRPGIKIDKDDVAIP